MEIIWKQIKHFIPILFIALQLNGVSIGFGQVKVNLPEDNAQRALRNHLKTFYHLVAKATVIFALPKGFNEIRVPDEGEFAFDYGIELPGQDFEIWFKVKPQKENQINDLWYKTDKFYQQDDPDSLYSSIAEAGATAFTGDKSYLERSIPHNYLAPYNADAGKSFLLTLLDKPETKHYKYALMFSLQKFHTGTIIAVCFTNEKGPEFFDNIEKAKNCLRFKQ